MGLTFAEGKDKDFSFLNKLSMLCEELAKHKKGVVILVDEVQSKTSEMRTLATAYQHLVGEGVNIAIVMAGLPHAISSVLNDDLLTFFNRAKKVHLGALSLNAVNVYYAQVFAGMGKAISAAQLEAITVATKGYPYLLQLIGYYLVELTESTNIISDDAVAQSLTNAKRDLIEGIYEPVLKPLSNKDIEFLRAMVVDDGSSKVADIKSRLKTTNANIQPYRRRLLDAGVIASQRRGELEIIVPSQRRGELEIIVP